MFKVAISAAPSAASATSRGHTPPHRRHQCQPKSRRLDERPRQNHRSRQREHQVSDPIRRMSRRSQAGSQQIPGLIFDARVRRSTPMARAPRPIVARSSKYSQWPTGASQAPWTAWKRWDYSSFVDLPRLASMHPRRRRMTDHSSLLTCLGPRLAVALVSPWALRGSRSIFRLRSR